MSLGSVFDIAAMGMSVQTVRLNTTASNMANADTSAASEAEAYKALHPVFVSGGENGRSGAARFDAYGSAGFGVMVREIVESQAPVNKAYEPNNPQANEEGYVFYSNVNTIEEMADMISASRSFQMNVEMMNTTKSMMQRLLSMGQ